MKNFQIFKSVLQLDTLRGWHDYKKKLIVFLSIILIITIGSINSVKQFDGNLSDLFFMVFKDVVFNKKELYIPVNWFLINIFIMFILGDFIHDNLRKDSTYLLLRIQKKTIFWLSKCAWVILNIIFIYTILIAFVFLLGGLFLGFEFGGSTIINNQIISEVQHINILVSMIFLYILTSITLVLIQCTLSIIMNSKYSFTIVAIILSLSIVSTFKLLIGTHSMILRHDYFNSELGISVQFSILYTLLISVGTIFLGNKLLEHKDFI